MDLLMPTTTGGILIFLLILVWTLPWKGYALWLAARQAHKWWFIIILVTNTLAILEIIYIFLVARPAQKKQEEDEEDGGVENV